MTHLTDEILERFSCMRCQECCRQPGFVYLKDGEADHIASFLGMNVYDFTDQYCEVEDKRHLVLKKLSDESCIFLTPTGCEIHAEKPLQCRDFPKKWRTPKSFNYCVGLKTLSNHEKT